MALRGGVGLDATLAAKIGTSIVSAQGVMSTLAPEEALAQYDMAPTGYTPWLCENSGFTMVGIAIMSWMALAGKDASQCIGCGLIPSVVSTLKALLAGTPAKYNVPNAGQYVNLAITGATMLATLTGHDAADILTKVTMAWCAINGVGLMAVPDVIAGAWGAGGAPDPNNTMMFKQMGSQIASTALMIYGLNSGWEATKIVGSTYALLLVALADMIGISKTAQAIGMDLVKPGVWGAVGAVVVAATLL